MSIRDRMLPLLESKPECLVEVIKADPKKVFFYVRLPDEVKTHLTHLGEELLKGTDFVPETNDHITLLFMPKFEVEPSVELIETLRNGIEKLVAGRGRIQAKIQGWAYFDGAVKDGESKTALVMLIDAVGLADLHVDVRRYVESMGLKAPQTHGFTPHATCTYLPAGARVPNLPVLDIAFRIDSIEMSNREFHLFPLA